MSEMTIINFKATKEFKQQVLKAAVNAGYSNISQFLTATLRKNPYVKQELEKKSKKVA